MLPSLSNELLPSVDVEGRAGVVTVWTTVDSSPNVNWAWATIGHRAASAALTIASRTMERHPSHVSFVSEFSPALPVTTIARRKRPNRRLSQGSIPLAFQLDRHALGAKLESQAFLHAVKPKNHAMIVLHDDAVGASR